MKCIKQNWVASLISSYYDLIQIKTLFLKYLEFNYGFNLIWDFSCNTSYLPQTNNLPTELSERHKFKSDLTVRLYIL